MQTLGALARPGLHSLAIAKVIRVSSRGRLVGYAVLEMLDAVLHGILQLIASQAIIYVRTHPRPPLERA